MNESIIKKYRRKPKIVDAIQFKGRNTYDYNQMLKLLDNDKDRPIKEILKHYDILKGYYIIKEDNSIFWMSKEEFEENYEIIE